MRERSHKHSYYYLLVGLIQVVGLLLVIAAGGNKQIQLTFIVLIAVLYVFWGVIHHKIHHDLHTKIVVEYVAMASLGIALMYLLLQ